MGPIRAGCLCGLFVLGVAAAASGQEGGDDQVYSKKDQRYKPREGEYGGITPGVIYPYADEGYAHRVEHKAPAKMRANTIFWVGFQPRDGGGSRVFVQTSSQMEVGQAVAGGVLVVHLTGGRLANANARRRLDTRFFESAVAEVQAARVSARRAGKGRAARTAGVDLAIRFRNAADAHEVSAGFTREPDGYYYLYLDFGAGTPLPDKSDGK